MNTQNISRNGIDVLHYYEDCKLTAYPDPASPLAKALTKAKISIYGLLSVPKGYTHLSGAPWTIFYGHTGPDVYPGRTGTQAEADATFARRIANEFEPAVRRLVTVPVTQAQFDALVSFAYNVGVGNLQSSTLLRLVNQGKFAEAAEQFTRWISAQGQKMLGLYRRRLSERALFLGKTAVEAIRIGQAATKLP